MATMQCHRCSSSVQAGPSPRCPVSAPRISHRSGRTRKPASSFTVNCVNPRAINSINAAVALARPTSRRLAPATRQGGRGGDDEGHLDVLGLGQAIVDLSSSVTDEALQSFDLEKGSRRVITAEERSHVMETLDEMGCPSQVSAGGSLANTLVGVARLARAAGKDMRVSLGGSLGTDTLGQYFNHQLGTAGVRCLVEQPAGAQQPAGGGSEDADAAAGGHTGTVMVLTTPDAQRSFLSFFTSETLAVSEQLRAAIRSSRMVVVEGYMWEMAGAEAYIGDVIDAARAAGTLVALTAGDPGVVSRHHDAIRRVIAKGVDMVFTNEDEAAALVGAARRPDGGVDGRGAAVALAQLCSLAVVTAGSSGSYVCAMGEVHEVPPFWLPQGPVDTCGAGDAYAAGWLYSMLMGYDIRTAGEFASRVASAVIGRYGPHLSDEDAEQLVSALPEHTCPLRVQVPRGLQLGGGDYASI